MLAFPFELTTSNAMPTPMLYLRRPTKQTPVLSCLILGNIEAKRGLTTQGRSQEFCSVTTSSDFKL